jgi:hypothetical protein
MLSQLYTNMLTYGHIKFASHRDLTGSSVQTNNAGCNTPRGTGKLNRTNRSG